MNSRGFRIAYFFTLVLAVLLLAAGSQPYMSQPGGMAVSLLADASEETMEAEQPLSGEMDEAVSPEGNVQDENGPIESDENHDMLPEEMPAPAPEDGSAAEDQQMA